MFLPSFRGWSCMLKHFHLKVILFQCVQYSFWMLAYSVDSSGRYHQWDLLCQKIVMWSVIGSHFLDVLGYEEAEDDTWYHHSKPISFYLKSRTISSVYCDNVFVLSILLSLKQTHNGLFFFTAINFSCHLAIIRYDKKQHKIIIKSCS